MNTPQPPPGVPAPPPSKHSIRSRRMFYGMIAFSVIGILVVGFCLPIVFGKTCTSTPWTRALNDAKQIHLALIEFDGSYGVFPNQDSALVVANETRSEFVLGTSSSNDFFRQLLATGNGNEKMFYARIRGSKSPDDILDKEHALEKGECGFSYIPGYSSSSNPSFPVLITPLIPGTDRIDNTIFKGKALVLRLDGYAGEADVDKQGHVTVFGKRLLDPGNPIWEGRTPIIAWPE